MGSEDRVVPMDAVQDADRGFAVHRRLPPVDRGLGRSALTWLRPCALPVSCSTRWHSRPVRRSRSCSPTSRARHGSSARPARRPGRPSSPATTTCCARRSRAAAGSSSRPRATPSSPPSTRRHRPSPRPLTRSGRSPPRRWPDDLAHPCPDGRPPRRRPAAGRRANVDDDYVGIDVNYAARITAAANGGQIVVSDAVVGGHGRGACEDGGPRRRRACQRWAAPVKDFEDPARLYRLVVPGVADDPRPLRTLDAPSNLPGEVTSFVGRRRRSRRSARDLVESRIVTLTGPGGSGKTRLALAVARDVRDRYPHGVWFIDLAALRDAALVEAAIAATLGVRESPERAIGDALHAYLRDRTGAPRARQPRTAPAGRRRRRGRPRARCAERVPAGDEPGAAAHRRGTRAPDPAARRERRHRPVRGSRPCAPPRPRPR